MFFFSSISNTNIRMIFICSTDIIVIHIFMTNISKVMIFIGTEDFSWSPAGLMEAFLS